MHPRPRPLLVLAALVLLTAASAACSPAEEDCAPVAELCNGADDDCDGDADEGFGVGDACTAGVGACTAAGHLACAPDGGRAECDAAPGAPAAEACNQSDDDCDGETDEGLPGCCVPGTVRACGASEGVCVAGTETCSPAGGWGECLDGAGAAVVLPGTRPEVCNGSDDDCDAATDEGFAVGASCSAGVGACLRTGTTRCRADGTATECGATAGSPRAETCDGTDEDCDGQTDEGLAAPACPKQAGVCAGSRATCGGPFGWMCMLSSYGPSYEETETRCDGLDNDCDGTTDEGCPPP